MSARVFNNYVNGDKIGKESMLYIHYRFMG